MPYPLVLPKYLSTSSSSWWRQMNQQKSLPHGEDDKEPAEKGNFSSYHVYLLVFSINLTIFILCLWWSIFSLVMLSIDRHCICIFFRFLNPKHRSLFITISFVLPLLFCSFFLASQIPTEIFLQISSWPKWCEHPCDPNQIKSNLGIWSISYQIWGSNWFSLIAVPCCLYLFVMDVW